MSPAPAVPPGIDPTTGEITNEAHFRPFAELLTTIEQGEAHAEASRALHDLVSAVMDVGKAGVLTITVKVEPVKGNKGQVLVGVQVAAKPPKSSPGAGVFFVDDAGNLSRHDPRQMVLDGLRVVEPKPARTVATPGS